LQRHFVPSPPRCVFLAPMTWPGPVRPRPGFADSPLSMRRAVVLSRADSSCGARRRKRPVAMQQRLKAAGGAAGVEVVPPELLEELDVSSEGAVAALDRGLATGTPGGACSSAQKLSSCCVRLTMTTILLGHPTPPM